MDYEDVIRTRVLEEAGYIVDHNATVRTVASMYDVSKSNVHKDLTERLWNYNAALADKVREVLDKNKAERHLRGGMATRQKYLSLKDS